MNLLTEILQAQGGNAVTQLARQFNLNEGQTSAALSQLVPALSGGVKHNVQQGGLESLLSALQNGHHDRYLDEPQRLDQEETVQDGNAILGHLFGDKEVSRQVAGRAANNTGISSSILKKMLPVVATMVMGGLTKQTSGGGALGALLGSSSGRQSQGLESLVTSFLDADGDGNIADDLIGRFFK